MKPCFSIKSIAKVNYFTYICINSKKIINMTSLKFDSEQLFFKVCEGVIVAAIYDLIKYLISFLLAL